MSASRAILCMVLAVAVAGVVHASRQERRPYRRYRARHACEQDRQYLDGSGGRAAGGPSLHHSVPRSQVRREDCAFFRDLPVGSEVELTLRADRRNVANVLLLAGPAQRYLPQRIVGAKDELDKDVLRAIVKAKVGDRVEAMWFHDGERRMCSLKPAAAAE